MALTRAHGWGRLRAQTLPTPMLLKSECMWAGWVGFRVLGFRVKEVSARELAGLGMSLEEAGQSGVQPGGLTEAGEG